MAAKKLPTQSRDCTAAGALMSVGACAGILSLHFATAAVCLYSGWLADVPLALKCTAAGAGLAALAAGSIYAGYRLGKRHYDSKISDFMVGAITVMALAMAAAITVNQVTRANRPPVKWNWEKPAATENDARLKSLQDRSRDSRSGSALHRYIA